MKTTKIQAEAKRVTTTTITFEIDGKKVSISEQDARAIYNELGKLFGQQVRDWMEQNRKESRPRPRIEPQWPLNPPIIMNCPQRETDFMKVTCYVNTGALS